MDSPPGPLCTRDSLTADLRAVLCTTDTVLVHSSLRRVGWLCGGAPALIHALLDTVPAGTVVVPTHTSENSDPADWRAPPVPASWWPIIRASTPAFDPATSRTRQMGVVAESLRTWPGSRRSAHPQTSFAAVGPLAETITAGHQIDCMLGEASPLARLEEADAKVLLLGVGWHVCTAFHLAESRLAMVRRGPNWFAAMVDGTRQWVTVGDMQPDADDFEALGAAFEAQTGKVTKCRIGAAECRVFKLRDAVEFAENWLLEHRSVA